VLGRLDSTVDSDHVLRLALVHDLPETRTGDLNYVHQKYVAADEAAAAAQQARGLVIADELEGLLAEYRDGTTPEARVAHDADQLEMLLSLKERLDGGATAAEEWIPFVKDRLSSAAARRLAEHILAGHSHDWWFDRDSDWWVHGSKR
jgi:putative hydrolase of HD superfamily